MEYFSIHKFSKIIGRTPQTLRNWEKAGYLTPHHKGPNGYRYYSRQQLDEVLGIVEAPRKIIGYCRVSDKKQKDDLALQIQNMEEYLSTLDGEYEIIHDIGSSMNYKNKGLLQLLKRIISNEVSKVVVFNEDRLLRLGFELVEYIAGLHKCEVVVLNSTDAPEQEELVGDMLQIITELGKRLDGEKAQKTRQLIDALSKP